MCSLYVLFAISLADPPGRIRQQTGSSSDIMGSCATAAVGSSVDRTTNEASKSCANEQNVAWSERPRWIFSRANRHQENCGAKIQFKSCSISISIWVDRIPRMHALSYTYYIVNPKQFSWSQIISITLCNESKYSTMMYHGYAPMLGMCAIPTKALESSAKPPLRLPWWHCFHSLAPQALQCLASETRWDPVDPTTYTYPEGSSHQYVLAVLVIRAVLDVRFLQAPEKPSTQIWSWVMVMFFKIKRDRTQHYDIYAQWWRAQQHFRHIHAGFEMLGDVCSAKLL